jgi:hypothetical protein
LRENHEVTQVSATRDFKAKVEEQLNSREFYDSTSNNTKHILSIARIRKKYFWIHGGTSPQLTSFTPKDLC